MHPNNFVPQWTWSATNFHEKSDRLWSRRPQSVAASQLPHALSTAPVPAGLPAGGVTRAAVLILRYLPAVVADSSQRVCEDGC
ncbi:MAG: hypothetical protein QOE74_5160 [Mycobacterium sp.]|nr:hypothetical protein [Mycobacterium sp.]